jgi:hypothetical protein
MRLNMIRSYLQRIADITKRGDAREESYYRPLADPAERSCSEKRNEVKTISLHTSPLPRISEEAN